MKISPDPFLTDEGYEILRIIEPVISSALTDNFVFVDHKLQRWDTFIREINYGELEIEHLQLNLYRFAQIRLLVADHVSDS